LKLSLELIVDRVVQIKSNASKIRIELKGLYYQLGGFSVFEHFTINIDVKKACFSCLLACLHDQNKSGFLEGRLSFNQSKQFGKYLKSSYWLEKAGPPKNHFCFDHVNRLYIHMRC